MASILSLFGAITIAVIVLMAIESAITDSFRR